MKLIYGLGGRPKKNKEATVVTVGVFDGVHRGHQLILRKVVREAKKCRLKSAVVTFSSHPSTAFKVSEKIPHLMTLEHKLQFIEREGIDLCYVIHFNRSFSRLSPQGFVEDLLVKKIGMVSLYVGEDFVFGRRRSGNKDLLRHLAQFLHFRLQIVRHLKIKNRIVSSTRIRHLIRYGRLKEASVLLGHPVSCLGKIVRGDKRGKLLGFPTANILPHHEVLAPDGIYAAWAFFQGQRHKSVAYIGRRPTFYKKNKTRCLEVYLFHFKKMIYGKLLEIQFIEKIRNDKKFSSPQSLIAQIKKDVNAASALLR